MLCSKTQIFIPGIPKCGSTAIDNHFSQFGTLLEKQHTSVELGVKKFISHNSTSIRHKVLVYRNPVDRFSSIYSEFCKPTEFKKFKTSDHPLRSDVDRALDDIEYFYNFTKKHQHIHWNSIYKNSDFKNVDYLVINLETLSVDLERLNKVIFKTNYSFDLAVINKSSSKNYINKNLEKLLMERYVEDLEIYNKMKYQKNYTY